MNFFSPQSQDLASSAPLSLIPLFAAQGSKLEIPREVGDCTVAKRRQWRPPHQTGKIVHVREHALRMISDPGTVASLYKHDWSDAGKITL